MATESENYGRQNQTACGLELCRALQCFFPTACSLWAIMYPGKLEVPAPTGHKNQTWDPELRIETLDPD